MNIGFNEAKQFLDELEPSDDVCLIFHNDLDGLASGVLLYDWCKMKGIEKPKIKIFCSEYFIGDEHKKCNKVIVADVFQRGFNLLSYPREQEVLYLDHHPRETKILPPNVLEYRTTGEGYIPSSRTIQELTGLKRWLGVCGVLGDSGDLYPENNDYINSFLQEKGITLGEFKIGVSNVLLNSIFYFKEDLISFFNLLREKEQPEDLDDLRRYSEIVDLEVEKGINYYMENRTLLGLVNYCFMDSKFKYVKLIIETISKRIPEEIFMTVKPNDKEGFYSMSLRVQNNNYNLNALVVKAVEGIPDSSGGGHPRAPGGCFRKEDLPKIKKRIEELSLEMFK